MQHYYCNGCETFTREHLMDAVHISDPYGTGDTWYTETEPSCPECHSSDVEEMEPCDACATNVPLDGMDDCAFCIMGDRYNHNTRYDAGDHEAARQWLARHQPADLATVEEIADERRNHWLEARAEAAR